MNRPRLFTQYVNRTYGSFQLLYHPGKKRRVTELWTRAQRPMYPPVIKVCLDEWRAILRGIFATLMRPVAALIGPDLEPESPSVVSNLLRGARVQSLGDMPLPKLPFLATNRADQRPTDAPSVHCPGAIPRSGATAHAQKVFHSPAHKLGSAYRKQFLERYTRRGISTPSQGGREQTQIRHVTRVLESAFG